MLQRITTASKRLDDYLPIVGEEVIEEIRELADRLRGARVLHVNATAMGGGVAEILYSLVPLMRDIGLDAEWQVIHGEAEFYNVTKVLHNTLQGADIPITPEMKAIYRRYSETNAKMFEGSYDYAVIHDPQPAALLYYHGRGDIAHWIWRCHIDTSAPNQEAWGFLRPYMEMYDAAIFTLPQYVCGDLHLPHIAILAPTIDPLSPKNQPLTLPEAQRLLRKFGVDPDRPLFTQVSRFDPWKDPLGVIDAYRMVKVEVPQLQLALVGVMASDDPEGWDFYGRTLRHAGEDDDIFILHNLNGIGNLEVNAFQTASDVVIQKSLREGFGLVVAEAMWKGKPVIGGNAGGIPLQVINGQTGYLVESRLECAERAYYLLRHPEERKLMGEQARQHVLENFLTTRILNDYLRLFLSLQ